MLSDFDGSWLKRSIPYTGQGVARYVLMVDDLPQGAISRYAANPISLSYNPETQEESLYALSTDSGIVVRRVDLSQGQEEFLVPTWEIRAKTSDRVATPSLVEKAKRSLALREDETLCCLLKEACSLWSGGTTLCTNPELLFSSLLQASTAFPDDGPFVHGLLVRGRSLLDSYFEQAVLAFAELSRMDHHMIMTSRYVGRGEVYILARPEYLGGLPVRQDVVSLTDGTKNPLAYEEIGMFIQNHKCVRRVVVPSTEEQGDPVYTSVKRLP